jgi:hypothetical protein
MSAFAQIGVCCSYCAGPDQCQNAGEATFTKCQISHLGELTWCDTVGTGYCRVCNPFQPTRLTTKAFNAAIDACDAADAEESEIPPSAKYDRDAVMAIGRANPAVGNLLSMLMMRIGTGQQIPLNTIVQATSLDAFDYNAAGAATLDAAHRTGALSAPVPNPGSRGRGISFSFTTVEVGQGQTLVRITPDDPAIAPRFGFEHEALFQKTATPEGGIFVKLLEFR